MSTLMMREGKTMTFSRILLSGTAALALLENYLRVRVADGKSVALILDFAETLAPAEDDGVSMGLVLAGQA